ncbi:GTP-binding protein [Clostridium sp.]|uniref:CobW family GTP-binding protein n=1 Tax=Clostridium sp. TaxID=1506 RepID=UPI00260B33D4|nr:GTP-binding protein [Clostridium sp.]
MKSKIDIFSGFLGAGKTYLMKKLIEEGAYEEKIVIIENEFGEVSIDSEILKGSNIDIKEINSGCICCQVTGDFKDAILEVINNYNPSRIIVEPSGVAKLTDIMKIFNEKEIKNRTEIHNIITLIDPEKYDRYIENFNEFYVDQIKNAKKIVISRTQKVSKSKVLEVKGKLEKLNKKATIIYEDFEKLNSKFILNYDENKKIEINEVKGIRASFTKKENTSKKAKEVFESFAIYPTLKLSKEELKSKFDFISKSQSYGDIIRAKGIVKLQDGTIGQFDFVKEEFVIRTIGDNGKNVISFIGVNLRKEELKGFFK